MVTCTGAKVLDGECFENQIDCTDDQLCADWKNALILENLCQMEALLGHAPPAFCEQQ